jgi:hypothetical protein
MDVNFYKLVNFDIGGITLVSFFVFIIKKIFFYLIFWLICLQNVFKNLLIVVTLSSPCRQSIIFVKCNFKKTLINQGFFLTTICIQFWRQIADTFFKNKLRLRKILILRVMLDFLGVLKKTPW